jgi:hypothetical protein
MSVLGLGRALSIPVREAIGKAVPAPGGRLGDVAVTAIYHVAVMATWRAARVLVRLSISMRVPRRAVQG